jgi:hypothetical protein
MISKILQYRDLEKEITKKIAKFLSKLEQENNGRIPKNKTELVSDFYKYSLNHFITSIKDIPNKYQEIFAD